MHQEKQPILFLHLLKTAGTAFMWGYLEKYFPEGTFLSHFGHHQEAAQSIARIKKMSPSERENIKVIFGHIIKDCREIFPGAPNFAILRNPVKRALSQYFYERQSAESLGLDPAKRPLYSEVSDDVFWDNFIEWGRRGNFNLQNITMAHYLGMDTKSMTEGDIHKILDQFAFIGIQDHFQMTIFLLSELHGFPLRNVPSIFSGKHGFRGDVPQHVHEAVRELSPLEYLLFELAEQKFKDMCSEVFGGSLINPLKWKAYKYNCGLNNLRLRISPHVSKIYSGLRQIGR